MCLYGFALSFHTQLHLFELHICDHKAFILVFLINSILQPYFMVTYISSWTSIIMLGFERWITIHIVQFILYHMGRFEGYPYEYHIIYSSIFEKKKYNLHTKSRQNLLCNLKNISYILPQKRDQSNSKRSFP